MSRRMEPPCPRAPYRRRARRRRAPRRRAAPVPASGDASSNPPSFCFCMLDGESTIPADLAPVAPEGWVERSETHHLWLVESADGFRTCSTHPTAAVYPDRPFPGDFHVPSPQFSPSAQQGGGG